MDTLQIGMVAFSSCYEAFTNRMDIRFISKIPMDLLKKLKSENKKIFGFVAAEIWQEIGKQLKR